MEISKKYVLDNEFENECEMCHNYLFFAAT